MNIQFELPNEELHEIKELLISNLNLVQNLPDNELEEKLNNLAKAAFFEYLEMITNAGMPSKISDVQQNRIMHLIEYYFKKFPNETEIARIFNIQTTRSRSILNSLKASQRNKLSAKIRVEIISLIRSGRDIGNNKWEFEVKSKPIIQEINEIISLKRPGLEKFKQKLGSASKVTLHQDSVTFIKNEFQIQ